MKTFYFQINTKISRWVILFVFALLTISSCVTEEMKTKTISLDEKPMKTKTTSEVESYDVSEEEARYVAAVHQKDGTFTITPIEYEGKNLLYICNFEKGWMLISGDKRAKPILAESRTGKMDLEEAPEGILVWLNTLAEDISCIKQEFPEQKTEHTEFWRQLTQSIEHTPIFTKADPEPGSKWYAVSSSLTLTSEIDTDLVAHLIPIKWGQDAPWNRKCPIDISNNQKCPLGCVATAIGQLLYFTHYELWKPMKLYHTIIISQTSVNGSTQNIGFSRSNLVLNSSRWDDMALTRAGYQSCDTLSSFRYVGDLLLDIGNRFGMHYSGSGSGADMDAVTLSSSYGIHCSSGDYDFSIVQSDLENYRPVIISAYSTQGFLGFPYSDGHCWLIDGLHATIRNYSFTKHFEYGEEWVQYSEVYDTFDEIQQIYGIQSPSDVIPYNVNNTTHFLLMNWGYDGDFDTGLYSVGATDNWYANNSNHQYLRTIYHNIH